MNSSSDTPIDSDVGLAERASSGTGCVVGWLDEVGWGVAGFSTTGVRISVVSTAGEEGAGVSVAGVAIAGLADAGAMESGIVVAGEVVAEETESVPAGIWVAVDRDTKPLTVSFSWILKTPDATRVPDDPALQATRLSNTKAARKPRPDWNFDKRFI